MMLNRPRRTSRTSPFAWAIPLCHLMAWSVTGAQGSLTGQPSARSNYVLIRRSDTSSIESVERQGNSVHGEIQIFSSRPSTYKYSLQLTPDALVSRFELDVFLPNAVSVAKTPSALRPQMSLAITFRNDSMIAETRTGDSSRVDRIDGATATLPYVGPSVAIFEQISRRARALGVGNADVPIIRIGGNDGGVTVAHVTQISRDSVVITVAGGETRLAIDANGNVLGGTTARDTRILLGTTAARPKPTTAADPKDVSSIDAIITALYESDSRVVDTKTGAERFRSLYLPTARLVSIAMRPNGSAGVASRTPDEFLEDALQGQPRGGFREREIARTAEVFGNIAHVFSTYEGRRNASDVNPTRGINSFQLFFDGSRWWLTSVLWDVERSDNPIPAKYLPPKTP